MGMQRLDMFEYVWIIELIQPCLVLFQWCVGPGPRMGRNSSSLSWVIVYYLGKMIPTCPTVSNRLDVLIILIIDTCSGGRSRQILTSDSFSSFLGTNKWWSPFARSWHFPCCSQWITFTPAVSYIESHGRTNVWNDENAQNSFGDGGCQKWDRMQMQQLPDVFCEHWTSYWSAAS